MLVDHLVTVFVHKCTKTVTILLVHAMLCDDCVDPDNLSVVLSETVHISLKRC